MSNYDEFGDTIESKVPGPLAAWISKRPVLHSVFMFAAGWLVHALVF